MMMMHREGPAAVWWVLLLAFVLSGVYCVVRCTIKYDGVPGCRTMHASHALMAAGMVDMFVPVASGALVRGLWQSAFGGAAGYFLVSAVRAQRAGAGKRMLSDLHHVVAHLAMVYMFAMPGVSVVGITTVLIAYFMVTMLIDGSVLAQGAIRRGVLGSWASVTLGTRMVMAVGMVYMLGIMDDVSGTGMHMHMSMG